MLSLCRKKKSAVLQQNKYVIFSDLNVKLDISKHTIQQQDQALVEKEREAVRRVQAAREEEFEKFAKVENEKYGYV